MEGTMRDLLPQRLSVQITLVAIGLIAFVSAAISVPLIELRHSELMEQARLRTTQAGRTLVAVHEERMAFAKLLAELLADRPQLVELIRADDSSAIRAFVRQTRSDTLFDLVTVVDTAGVALAQDGNALLWRSAQSADASPLLWGLPGSGLVVEVRAPIRDATGQVGAVIGSYTVGESLLEGVRAQTDIDLSFLFGDRLVATSHPHRADEALGPLQEGIGAALLIHATPAFADATIGGAPYLARYKPLLAPDGRAIGMVEVLLPLTPVYEAQRRATEVVLGIALLASAVAGALGWYMARRLSGPVRRLVRAADAIGGGNLGQSVAATGPAELRALGHSVERMRRQIRAARGALEAEKSHYANILASLEEGVITLDAHERVTSLNHAAERLLGWSEREARDHPLHEVVPRDGEGGLALHDIPATGAAQVALRTRDGQLLVASVTRAVLDDGATQTHVLVLRDVSDETAVVRLKEEFLANITHEFRTPLAALIASLEILQDGDDLTTAERQQMLATIGQGVQRLDTLVQNLLDSASLQAGYFRVEPQAVPLAPLLAEAIQTVRPLIQRRGQRVVVGAAERVPLVLADDRRLVQVLVNLLSNASKFGPPGETIVVGVTITSGEVWISVTDRGPGVAAGRHERIFERFARPGAATVRAQGVGLGLAIVKAIVERHGGRVLLSSQPERGTTFTVTVPRATAQVAADAEMHHASA
jgi:PAS domain S-box-containing protein